MQRSAIKRGATKTLRQTTLFVAFLLPCYRLLCSFAVIVKSRIRINNAGNLAEAVELAANNTRGGYSALADAVGVNRATLYRWIRAKASHSISRAAFQAVCKAAGVATRAVTGIKGTASGMGASAVRRSQSTKVLSRSRKAFAASDFELQMMMVYWTIQRDGAVVSVLFETLRDKKQCVVTGCWPHTPDLIIRLEAILTLGKSVPSITAIITVAQDNGAPISIKRWGCNKLNPVEISNAMNPKRVKSSLDKATSSISTLRALTK